MPSGEFELAAIEIERPAELSKIELFYLVDLRFESRNEDGRSWKYSPSPSQIFVAGSGEVLGRGIPVGFPDTSPDRADPGATTGERSSLFPLPVAKFSVRNVTAFAVQQGEKATDSGGMRWVEVAASRVPNPLAVHQPSAGESFHCRVELPDDFWRTVRHGLPGTEGAPADSRGTANCQLTVRSVTALNRIR